MKLYLDMLPIMLDFIIKLSVAAQQPSSVFRFPLSPQACYVTILSAENVQHPLITIFLFQTVSWWGPQRPLPTMMGVSLYVQVYAGM
jgi:hypothetical protein